MIENDIIVGFDRSSPDNTFFYFFCVVFKKMDIKYHIEESKKYVNQYQGMITILHRINRKHNNFDFEQN